MLKTLFLEQQIGMFSEDFRKFSFTITEKKIYIYIYSNTKLQRELNICARSEARVCALRMSARTNLTARASSHPLALKCFNWQSLHEFSLNTDINVCCSGLTRCVVRFKLNRGHSACRTVYGEPYGSFLPQTVPSLIRMHFTSILAVY